MDTVSGDSCHNLQGLARRSGDCDCSIYGGLKLTNHFESIHNSPRHMQRPNVHIQRTALYCRFLSDQLKNKLERFFPSIYTLLIFLA
jgi:hypothetical protein